MDSNMGTNSIREHLRRRRLQRFARREALLLAQEAEMFDCPFILREARRLLEVTGGTGGNWAVSIA
jgi:hypothetical protein